MALTRHARDIPNSPDMGFDNRKEELCGGIHNCTECKNDVLIFKTIGLIPNPLGTEPSHIDPNDAG